MRSWRSKCPGVLTSETYTETHTEKGVARSKVMLAWQVHYQPRLPVQASALELDRRRNVMEQAILPFFFAGLALTRERSSASRASVRRTGR